MAVLIGGDDELSLLAEGEPMLVDAADGAPTGMRLLRRIGSGGMASVFLVEVDEGASASGVLSPGAPRRLALKLNKPSTERALRRLNLEPLDLFRKELVALGRVMERRPPTAHVLRVYGSGTTEAQVDGWVLRLPWLALELVEGEGEGVTLGERQRAVGRGFEPPRALALLRGVLEGAAVLHEVGVIHRDLKPDNVFVAGPEGQEVAKIADCGIARIAGLAAGTIAAITPAYGGPEQVLSSLLPTRQNPLIGPWTDVHALAAIAWFVVAGEDWCRGEGDHEWHRGRRRSLAEAERPHPAFADERDLFGQLDALLQRAASPAPPPEAWRADADGTYRDLARNRFGDVVFDAPPRPADVATFAGELLPLLERFVARFDGAAGLGAAPAVYGATVLQAPALRTPHDRSEIQARRVLRPPRIAARRGEASELAIEAALVLPDGKILARSGEALHYVLGERAHRVSVPAEHAAAVAATRWIGRAPGGGFVLASERALVRVRGGEFHVLPMPGQNARVAAGPLQAFAAEADGFVVVTADRSWGGSPEVWSSADGTLWEGPLGLPLGGEARAVARGRGGLLLVGAHHGSRARAVVRALDGTVVTLPEITHLPPLVAVCAAGEVFHAAADRFAVTVAQGNAAVVEFDGSGAPVAVGLDPTGAPWILTRRALLRRRVTTAGASWRCLHASTEGAPEFVAFGFGADGVRLLDARGGGVLLEPDDLASWRPTELAETTG